MDVKENSTCDVIFYIDSRLQKCAADFFKNVSERSSMHQALDILHNPSDDYGAFYKSAYGVDEEFMKDGGMDVWLNPDRFEERIEHFKYLRQYKMGYQYQR